MDVELRDDVPRASRRGRPRPVPCFMAVGVASSRMEPRKVVSCSREKGGRRGLQDAGRKERGAHAGCFVLTATCVMVRSLTLGLESTGSGKNLNLLPLGCEILTK